jgi:hypothetical protein
MDIPWTHIPPFSTTYKAGMGAQSAQLQQAMPPLIPISASSPMTQYLPAQSFSSVPQMDPYLVREKPDVSPWYTSVAPYPIAYRQQQGGFGIQRADDDVKLTVSYYYFFLYYFVLVGMKFLVFMLIFPFFQMHVPRGGAPGGILVMEMKANVYRPIY